MNSEQEYATLNMFRIWKEKVIHLYWEYIYAAASLTGVSFLLLAGLYSIQYKTVRIYNWNGKRYCYLGRAGVRRSGGGYTVRIGERMADLSYTTLYQVCPSKRFVRKNRYRDVALLAGKVRCMLHVETCMRQSVYYKRYGSGTLNNG